MGTDSPDGNRFALGVRRNAAQAVLAAVFEDQRNGVNEARPGLFL
jgi:hypothetical protein